MMAAPPPHACQPVSQPRTGRRRQGNAITTYVAKDTVSRLPQHAASDPLPGEARHGEARQGRLDFGVELDKA